jgi:hypothetical protein
MRGMQPKKQGGFIMIYSIFCTLNGKTIATIHGECADDNAAIAKARWYLRSSAADTARVHRDAPLYPLGEMIAELKAEPGQGSEPDRRFQAYFYSEADCAKTTIEAATPELALRRARQIESEETETLDFERYGSGAGVEHIEIRSAEGDTVAECATRICCCARQRGNCAMFWKSRRKRRRASSTVGRAAILPPLCAALTA